LEPGANHPIGLARCLTGASQGSADDRPRRVQRRPALVLLLGTVILGGCLATGPGPPPAASPHPPVGGSSYAPPKPNPAPPEPPESPHATPSSASAPLTWEALSGLPEISRDILALCDSPPQNDEANPSVDPLDCGDGLVYGLRAIATVASGPIERAWLRRPTC